MLQLYLYHTPVPVRYDSLGAPASNLALNSRAWTLRRSLPVPLPYESSAHFGYKASNATSSSSLAVAGWTQPQSLPLFSVGSRNKKHSDSAPWRGKEYRISQLPGYLSKKCPLAILENI